MKNRIGIDPSGTGTTAIAIYDDKGELKLESFKSDNWMEHYFWIQDKIELWYTNIPNKHQKYYYEEKQKLNCEFTTHIRVLTKDTVSLLNLEGVIKYNLNSDTAIDNLAVNSSHTKSVARKIKLGTSYYGITYESQVCSKCLTPKGNKKKCAWWINGYCISVHERDAIIIANWERKK